MWRSGHWGPLRDQVLPRAQAEETDRMYVIKSYIALTHTALTHEGLNSEGYPQDCLHLWEQGMQVVSPHRSVKRIRWDAYWKLWSRRLW